MTNEEMLCGQDIHQLNSYNPRIPDKAGPEEVIFLNT